MSSLLSDNISLKTWRLKGSEDWPMWKQEVSVILESQDLWDLTDEAASTTGLKDEELKAYKKKEGKAKAILWTSISQDIQPLFIDSAESAAQLWTALKKKYDRQSTAVRYRLEEELSRLTLSACTDAIDYANKFQGLVKRIGRTGESLSQTIQIRLFLDNIGPGYETWISFKRIMIRERLPDLEDLVNDFLDEVKEKGPSGNLAQMTLKEKTEKGACYYCGKPGHFKRECRARLKPNAGESRETEQKGDHSAAAVSTESGGEIRAWTAHTQAPEVRAQIGRDLWYLDSAATAHMTHQRNAFVSYKEYKDNITIADGTQIPVWGRGNVQIQVGNEVVQIHDVLHAPKLAGNLVSIGQLADRGISCNFTAAGAHLSRDGEGLAFARRVGRNYVFEPTREAYTARMSTAHDDSYRLWHRRLGHAGEEKMRLLHSAVDGVPALGQGPGETCETCATNKSIRSVNRDAPEPATQRLERVYTDFWGPFNVPTLGDAKYILTFTDDYSRKTWIYLTKARTELYDRFTGWRAEVEKQSGKQVKALRSDGAGEYRSLAQQLRGQGITFEFTTAYTPEQNGVAERLNRTLTTMIRPMLSGTGLPTALWGEAAQTSNYVRNRLPRRYGNRIATPEEMWTGKKTYLGHLKVFGCVAYTHVAKERRGKLDETAKRGIFVGYTPTTRQYRVFNPQRRTIELHTSVRFDESKRGGDLMPTPAGPKEPALDLEGLVQEEIGDTIVVQPRGPQLQRGSGSQEPDQTPDQESDQEPEPEPPRGPQDAGETNAERPRRSGIRLPERYRAQQAMATCDQEISTPTSYEEAISGPQKEQWEAAINDELRSHELNVVWTLVTAPKGANIVSCKWVFKLKRLPDGRIDRYKARLVARGFSQQHGVDYDETFAPVVRMETLRVLLAIAAAEDLEIHQMDVVTAYLAGELEEEIYMTPPPGVPGTEGLVCRLWKGLYGLKQSARVWNQRLTSELKRMGLRATTADPSVWVNKDRGLILALYVDDIVLIARETQELRRIKAALGQVFKMKDLGGIQNVLGLRVQRHRATRRLWIDQTHYIEDILKEFGHLDCRTVSTPADGYENLQTATAQDTGFADMALYQRALGQLNWLVRGTRPDLAFVVHKLSQFCHQPYAPHWAGVRRVFRYLNYSRHLRLCYAGDTQEMALIGYSDSDYAGDATDRRSTMGYIFLLHGAAVTWAARKQQSISTSTTEAEYVGLCNAAKEAVWLRSLFRDLGRGRYAGGERAMRIYSDNQGALRLTGNPEFHARSKHIDVQYHYVRELKETGVIDVEYVPTEEMAADCLTKPLKRQKFTANLKMVGLYEDTDGGGNEQARPHAEWECCE